MIAERELAIREIENYMETEEVAVNGWTAEAMVDIILGRRQHALAALRAIHFHLWPERYPVEIAREHPNYNAGDNYPEPFEWSSDTIGQVAEMVEEALADDPETPKGG